jgi:hypothetical protein
VHHDADGEQDKEDDKEDLRDLGGYGSDAAEAEDAGDESPSEHDVSPNDDGPTKEAAFMTNNTSGGSTFRHL